MEALKSLILSLVFATLLVALGGCQDLIEEAEFQDRCSNTCDWAFDGVCDDGAIGSETDACGYATDCADCGERPIP